MAANELTFSGKKLRETRESLGKTQSEVATFLEITPQSYGEMERGDINPNSSNLAKLCILFDCPVQTFFDIPAKFFSKV